MGVSIKRITNAVLIAEGGTYLGKAQQVTLPEWAMTYAEHKGLGMHAMNEFPVGLDKAEVTIVMNGLYKDFHTLASNPTKVVKIQVRSVQETFDGQTGRTATDSVVTFLTLQPKTMPGGDYKQHENVDFSYKFSVKHCRQEIAGEVVVEIDTINPIWLVDGVDLLAGFREALGI